MLSCMSRVARCWLLVGLVVGQIPLFSTTALGQLNQAGPRLYFFTNDGCAPCKLVEPAIETLQREGYPVSTVKVNQNLALARKMQIDRTPTILLFDGQNQLRGRSFSPLDANELRQWFAAVGLNRPSPRTVANPAPQTYTAGPNRRASGATAPDRVDNREVTQLAVSPLETLRNFSTPTMLKGTPRASTPAEQRAMDATVRLKVEDTAGVSYATGTVIHVHGNEALVMTCGHVFRDSGGKGTVTVEYDFYTNPRRATGKLIDYDADARDVALVAIRTDRPLQPVPLAGAGAEIAPGLDIFSIGCDRGNNPTIRHSKIKNKAKYDNAAKYDIYGRPVVGRSGGGLFTPDGKLIGVCNAAVVDVDEGIYTSLETLHWQVAHVGLAHLFQNQPRDARLTQSGTRNRSAGQAVDYDRSRYAQPPANLQRLAPVGRTALAGHEVIIQIRSRENPGATDTISIKDPTPELLRYLETMKR